MVRNYQKRPSKYSEETVHRAVTEVKQGNSLRSVAKKYDIDKSFLSRRILEKHTGRRGRKTVLSKQQETELAKHLELMAKWGFALTKKEVIQTVQDYVLEHNLQTPFKDNTPGDEWFRGFCSRNALNLRKHEALDKARRSATSDPYIIYPFYELLDKTIDELGLRDKPSHIWNLDETYFCSDPNRVPGVARKGQKVHRTIQGTGKANTSVLACCSADGRKLPPLIIYEASYLWSSWRGTEDIPGTFYANSPKGYMTAPVFLSFMEKFVKTVTERPLLLVFDGHMAHLLKETIELAVEHQITILKLPPHTTDLLQPLDKCCFSPLKLRWNEKLLTWQHENNRTLTKCDFANLLCSVWEIGLPSKNIIAGFKSTGIFPPDSSKYPVDRLNPDKLSRYNAGLPMDLASSTPNLVAVSNSNVGLREMNEQPPEDVMTLSPHLTTESTNRNEVEQCSSDLTHPSEEFNMPSTSHEASHCNLNTARKRSFEELLLSKLKKTSPPNAQRRKIDRNAAVITSEEYLKAITEKEKIKSRNKAKDTKSKKKKLTKHVVSSSSSSDESNISDGEDSSNSDAQCVSMEEEMYETLEVVDNLASGDFILVSFKGGRRGTVKFRYVCVIQKLLDVDDIEVMSLHTVEGKKNTFRLNESDVSVVDKCDVIGKLPIPDIVTVGNRCRYIFKKDIDILEM